MAWNAGARRINISLAPRRFLNRLKLDLILNRPAASGSGGRRGRLRRECRGDAIGRDAATGEISSKGKFWARCTPWRWIAGRFAGDRAVRLRRKAGAAGRRRAAAGDGRATGQTYRHGLG